MTPRYLNVEAAAAYLGDTEWALRHKVQRREIPFIKDGRRIKFDRHDLDAHMARHRVEVAS